MHGEPVRYLRSMRKIGSIHDNFFRNVMSGKSIAVDYFRNYRPSLVSEQLDFSTLTQLPAAYVFRRPEEEHVMM